MQAGTSSLDQWHKKPDSIKARLVSAQGNRANIFTTQGRPSRYAATVSDPLFMALIPLSHSAPFPFRTETVLLGILYVRLRGWTAPMIGEGQDIAGIPLLQRLAASSSFYLVKDVPLAVMDETRWFHLQSSGGLLSFGRRSPASLLFYCSAAHATFCPEGTVDQTGETATNSDKVLWRKLFNGIRIELSIGLSRFSLLTGQSFMADNLRSLSGWGGKLLDRLKTFTGDTHSQNLWRAGGNDIFSTHGLDAQTTSKVPPGTQRQ